MSHQFVAHYRMRKWVRRGLVAAVFVGVASSPLWWNAAGFAQDRTNQRRDQNQPQKQQEPDEAQMAEMIKKYEEAAAPGKFHDYLKPLAGNWQVSVEFTGPGGVMTSQGQATSEWVLGERFIKQEFSGEMMGREFKGIGYTGYDNSTKQYQATWMDSMSTAIFYMEGAADEEGRVITLHGQGVDPLSGEMKTYKHVWRLESDEQNVMEMYEPGPEGQMTKTATLTYKRAR